MSIIEMRDVVKKYDNGTTALRGVSVSIEPGEFAYIVGPSGAGKSTFIRALYREVKVEKGNYMGKPKPLLCIYALYNGKRPSYKL